MEARRFGFGASSVPPAYKFDPTDADIVAHYLLPRAVGIPNPYAHAAVIDADPCSCPPWELLRRHGHAFFFGPAVPKRTKTGRRHPKRAVSEGEEGGGGGTWVLSRTTEESLVLVRGGGVGGAEMELRYKKRYLTHRSNDDARNTGRYMNEYQIADPRFDGAVLSRVRMTARGKNKFQKQQAKELAPGPEQPGPRNYLDDAGNYVVMGQGEGTSGEAVHQGDNSGGFMGEMTGYYSSLPGAGEDGGYYVDNSNSYFSNNYCFNEGDGSGYYFLQDDGGNGD